MAKFLLGALVTNIAGSIGGTTFRRVPNGLSMFNKIRGTSKSRLLQNNRLPEIGQIFQRWSQLTDTQRAGWNAQALLVTFPDKFGNQKNLTGRELFSKSNIQLLPTGSSVINSDGFTKDTVPFEFASAVWDLGADDLLLSFNGLASGVTFLISAEVSNKSILQPTFKSRKVILQGAIDLPGDFDVLPSLLENFPYVSSTMEIIFYVQQINSFGMLSPYQYSYMLVAP